MPVPSCVRERELLHAMKSLEDVREFRRGNADARIAHRELDVTGSPSQGDRNLPVERVLQRVAEKIQDDLLPHLAIDVDGFGQAGTVDHQPQAGFFDRRPEDAREVRGHGAEVGRLIARLDASRFDPREVEQRVDEFQQPQAVAMRDVEPLARLRIRTRARPRAARA